VIVAASSINSPKLLMLSGIGPAAHLPNMGIEVVADRPGVGANLQDHLELYFQQESTKPITLYSWCSTLVSKALIGAQWLFFKGGLGASNQFEACAFVRSAGVEASRHPVSLPAAAVRYDGKAAAKSTASRRMSGRCGRSRAGRSRCARPTRWPKPVIRFNYMSHEDDWDEFRHCIRLTREIFGQPAIDPSAAGNPAGQAVQSDDRSDAFHARACRKRLSSLRHLPHGRADDPDGGGRSGMPGDRRRGPARRRQFDLPARHQRQPQRAVDHDRREGRRPYSRPHAADTPPTDWPRSSRTRPRRSAR
jgi:choline dehydrogenase